MSYVSHLQQGTERFVSGKIAFRRMSSNMILQPLIHVIYNIKCMHRDYDNVSNKQKSFYPLLIYFIIFNRVKYDINRVIQ